MKKFILLFVLIISIIACNKSEVEVTPEVAWKVEVIKNPSFYESSEGSEWKVTFPGDPSTTNLLKAYLLATTHYSKFLTLENLETLADYHLEKNVQIKDNKIVISPSRHPHHWEEQYIMDEVLMYRPNIKRSGNTLTLSGVGDTTIEVIGNTIYIKEMKRMPVLSPWKDGFIRTVPREDMNATDKELLQSVLIAHLNSGDLKLSKSEVSSISKGIADLSVMKELNNNNGFKTWKVTLISKESDKITNYLKDKIGDRIYTRKSYAYQINNFGYLTLSTSVAPDLGIFTYSFFTYKKF